jgi:hypothetical protein
MNSANTSRPRCLAGFRTVGQLAVLVSACAISLGAEAALVYVHNGALDPVTEGWAADANSHTGTTAGPVYNDLGSGYDAWAVDDNSTAAGSLRYYFEDLSATTHHADTAANGWRLSVRLRIVNASDGFTTVSGFGTASTIAAYYRTGDSDPGPANNSRDWYLGFGSQADGDPLIRLPNSTGGTYTFEGGGSGYHLYELVYDPTALSADFFIDGVEEVSNIVGNLSPYSGQLVAWGATTSPDAGQGNFNYVRFATTSVVPLPPAVLLFVSGIAALAGIRRQTAARG